MTTQEVIPQWQEAMRKGNAVRSHRAVIRRQLAGCASRREAWQALAGLIEAGWVEPMRVSYLLCSCYGTGEVLTAELLCRIGASEWRKVCELTVRQRTLLVEALSV